MTAKAGVASRAGARAPAFVDYDGDGALDLFVAHYLNWRPSAEVECFSLTGVPDYCSPASYDLPSASVLYHNNGDGTFTDVSARSGLTSAVGNGLGVVAGDFDGDGRIDMLVANDRTPNHLWLNQGGGRFREAALTMGCALDQDGIAKSGMGVDAVDVDDDGDLDLLVVNLDGESDSFFRNQGKFFVDETVVRRTAHARAGRSRGSAWRSAISTTTATSICTKRTAASAGSRSSILPIRTRSRACCFAASPGRGSRRWRLAAARDRCSSPRAAPRRSATSTTTAGSTSWSSTATAGRFCCTTSSQPRGHWMMFRVLEEHGRDALGAEVTMTVGSRTIRRDVRAASSYLASNDPRVHVGLGDETSGART